MKRFKKRTSKETLKKKSIKSKLKRFKKNVQRNIEKSKYQKKNEKIYKRKSQEFLMSLFLLVSVVRNVCHMYFTCMGHIPKSQE